MTKLIKLIVLLLLLVFGNFAIGDTNVGGLICSDTIWDLANSPYCVTPDAGGSVVIGCDSTLTIEPGVEVNIESGLAIMVGQSTWGQGTLVARGTEQQPITFTSVKDPNDTENPAEPGDWSRIHFTDYATDAWYVLVYDEYGNPDWNHPDNGYTEGCILQYVIVEYAGYGDYGAVFADKSSPCLKNCEIRHNSKQGIKVDGSHNLPSNIYYCEVWDNAARGIHIENGTGHQLFNNHIHHNNGGMYIESASFNKIYGNSILSNTSNYYDGGGGIYADGVNNSTFTFNVICDNTCNSQRYGGGGILFNRGGNNVITNNRIEGNSANGTKYGGGGLMIGTYCYNNIINSNIISKNSSSNFGGGLYFTNSDGNILSENIITSNNTDIEGGGFYFRNSDNNVLSTNTICDNTVIEGETGGIYLTEDSLNLSLAGNPDPNKCTYNIIRDNDGYQVYNNNSYNDEGNYDIDAQYVQWGTSDYLEIQLGNYDFFDDSIKAYVVAYPYICPGDFNMDEIVDLYDFSIITQNWLRSDCNGLRGKWCRGADVDLDSKVNMNDILIFVENWLAITHF